MYGVIKTYRALIAKISTYGKMTRDKRNRLGEEVKEGATMVELCRY